MTLTEFLEARLAEDELNANAAIEGPAEWHALYSYRDVKDSDGHYIPRSSKPHTSLDTTLPGSCASARPPGGSSPSSFALTRSETSPGATPQRRSSNSSPPFIRTTSTLTGPGPDPRREDNYSTLGLPDRRWIPQVDEGRNPGRAAHRLCDPRFRDAEAYTGCKHVAPEL